MIYSNSSLATFKKCPRKFKYRYIEKLEGAEKSEALKNGIQVHEDIEKGIESDKTRYALNIVRNVKKMEVAVTMKDGKEHRIFLNKKIPYLQIQEDKFGLDSSWKPCAFDAPLCKIRGMVDLMRAEINRQKMLAHIGEELVIEDFVEKVVIIDWKTGKRNVSEGKKQVLIYAIYYFELFPNVQEIEGKLVFLDEEKKEETFTITKEDTEKQKKVLEKQIEEIENTKDFRCIRCGLCDYCEYKERCFVENDAIPMLVSELGVKEVKVSSIEDLLSNL